MKVKLSALTEQAFNEFDGFLTRIKSGSSEDPPFHLLEGEDNIQNLPLSNGLVEIDNTTSISTREDLGKYLNSFLKEEDDLSQILDNKFVGSFLALLFFEKICARKADGKWSIAQIGEGKGGKDRSRYIPNLTSRQRFYRHLVLGPIAIYALHGATGRLYLCQDTFTHPDTMEQIASREELVLNKEIIKLVDLMYWDEEEKRVKPNVVSYDPVPDGAMRRFVGPGSFTEQYGVVYDFWNMTAEQIRDLLPSPEFDSWFD